MTAAHPFTPDEVAAEIAHARLERWATIVPPEFASATMHDLPSQLRDRLQQWMASPPGRNLVLHGEPSRGKTHAAWATLRELYLTGKGVMGRTMFDLLREMQREFNNPERNDVFSRMADAEYVLLDDVGAHRDTEWAAATITGLLDWRWRSQHNTIITTNCTVNELRDVLGERVADRVFGGSTLALRITGKNMRSPTTRPNTDPSSARTVTQEHRDQ